MSLSDLGTIGRGFNHYVNYDPSVEMPVEPFRGLVMVPTSSNPGSAFSASSQTVWLNSTNGSLYRGAVNLEETYLDRIEDLEDRVDDLETRVGDLETRMGAAETAIGSIQTTLATLVSYFDSDELTMTPSVPAEFGTVTATLTKSFKTVSLVVAPRVATLSSPTSVIQFNAQIPVGYRPPVGSEIVVPVAFRSNGDVDTGLVGSMRVDSGGGVYFVRDSDASPSDFTGSSGWDYSLVATWNLP